jgi:hypothetical protein
MRRLVAAVLLAAALPLAGCGGPGADSPADAPTGAPASAAPRPVALQRSGGIGGNRDAVTVRPDGSWRRTARTGAPSTGTLPADQQARLARMAADPALRAEATRTAPEPDCADGFDYRLTAGSTTVAWRECGSATTRPAIASGIASFLLDSTR